MLFQDKYGCNHTWKKTSDIDDRGLSKDKNKEGVKRDYFFPVLTHKGRERLRRSTKLK